MVTVCSKVLVPFDGSSLSKKALEMAITFLKQDENIELDVITIIREPYNYMGMLDIQLLVEADQKAATEALEGVGELLEAIPNKSRISVVEGEPADAVLKFIADHQIDFVIMGSRGLGKVEEVFLGSVSHHVLQKAPCPVMVVK